MITTILLQDLRGSEPYQFFNNFAEICEQNNASELLLNKPLEALQATNVQILEVINRNKQSDISQALVELDSTRDADLIGIKNIAEGFTYHFDESVSAAAKLIVTSFDKAGTNIARLNYQSETGTVNKLISDLENDPELVEALAKLSLTTWKDHLKEANDSFNNTFLSRVKEEADAPDIKLSDLRIQAIEQYRSLVTVIEARAVLSENGEYEALIEQLNVLVDKYNKIVASRQSHSNIE